jgi:hypothetical protein
LTLSLEIAEAVVLLLLAILVLSLLRSHAEILKLLNDLPVTDASWRRRLNPLLAQPRQFEAQLGRGLGEGIDLVGASVGGEPLKVSVSGGNRPNTLLAFLSSGCLTCKAFWEAISDPSERAGIGDARVVIVTKSADEESPSTIARLAPRDVPTLLSTDAWEDYGVQGSPFFIYVNGATGTIVGEGTATTWSQVQELIARFLNDHEMATNGSRAGRS